MPQRATLARAAPLARSSLTRRHAMSKSVAIVTGASQGIGQSTAIRLARDFSSIVLVARNREHLDATAARVKDAGAEPLVLDLDLADPAAAGQVVERTLAA